MWLKMLEQSHKGKIDVIYIDPPYNTGNKDFVYNDAYTDANEAFFHSKWLDFINRRLHLASSLLSDEGVIFISIDDREYAYLKVLCDEIFGNQNFIASIVVTSNSSKNNAKFIGVIHEFVLCYAKNIELLPDGWRVKKNNVDEFVKRAKQLVNRGLSQDEIHQELLELVKYPRFYDFDHFTFADKHGVYQTSDPGGVPNGNKDTVILHPITGRPCAMPANGWRYKETELRRKVEAGEIEFGIDETIVPRPKRYLLDYLDQIPKSVVFFDSQGTTKWVKSLGLDFPFPKAVALIKHVLSMYPKKDITVMDFFAGSGVTAHAVAELNVEDGGNRRWILVTNNEGETDDDPSTGIMRSVTKPRIDAVLTGLRPDGTRYSNGTGDGYSFLTYDIDSIPRSESPNKNRRMLAVPQCLDGFIRIRWGVTRSDIRSSGSCFPVDYLSKTTHVVALLTEGNGKVELDDIRSEAQALVNEEDCQRVIVAPAATVLVARPIWDTIVGDADIELLSYDDLFDNDFLS